MSGLGHLILMAVVWSNPTFTGMRIRRLVLGVSSWYLAIRLQFWEFDGPITLLVTVGSWFIAVAGTLLLLGSYLMYRSGRDLDKFP